MNNFVGNILQNRFYACCCILLSGTRPKPDPHQSAVLQCYFRWNWCRNLNSDKTAYGIEYS